MCAEHTSMLNGYNIKKQFVCKLYRLCYGMSTKALSSIVCFETIEETKVVSSHAMFLHEKSKN